MTLGFVCFSGKLRQSQERFVRSFPVVDLLGDSLCAGCSYGKWDQSQCLCVASPALDRVTPWPDITSSASIPKNLYFRVCQ